MTAVEYFSGSQTVVHLKLYNIILQIGVTIYVFGMSVVSTVFNISRGKNINSVSKKTNQDGRFVGVYISPSSSLSARVNVYRV